MDDTREGVLRIMDWRTEIVDVLTSGQFGSVRIL